MSAHVLTHWDPENPEFWKEKGAAIAQRNLWISIFALTLAFAIWVLWSVVTVNLNKVGFNFSKNQLFWLTALPALSGATFRVFYSFMVPIFGGRRWTVISTLSLLLPAVGMGIALQDSSTSYSTLLILAALCGLGGGNFSSSMANISFFFPKSEKGSALGLNAGLGNLGVSALQFIGPLAITVGLFGALGYHPLNLGDFTLLLNVGYNQDPGAHPNPAIEQKRLASVFSQLIAAYPVYDQLHALECYLRAKGYQTAVRADAAGSLLEAQQGSLKLSAAFDSARRLIQLTA